MCRRVAAAPQRRSAGRSSPRGDRARPRAARVVVRTSRSRSPRTSNSHPRWIRRVLRRVSMPRVARRRSRAPARQQACSPCCLPTPTPRRRRRPARPVARAFRTASRGTAHRRAARTVRRSARDERRIVRGCGGQVADARPRASREGQQQRVEIATATAREDPPGHGSYPPIRATTRTDGGRRAARAARGPARDRGGRRANRITAKAVSLFRTSSTSAAA